MRSDVSVSLENKGWLYHPDYPDDWERSPLYSLAQWVNGLAFRDIQFSPSGMPIIKIAEIKGGISGQTKFTEQTFDESVRIRPGDMLFSWSGQPETSIDVFWWHGQEGWLNQHVFRVTPVETLDKVFFYYLLRYLKPSFIGIACNKQTTGLGHVTKRDLENIEAGYPEPPEQRAIAHILGTLDDKIELNRRMSETLEAMARALFKSWFVDFDPVRAKMEGRWRKGESLPGLPADLWEVFPDRMVDSELGEIPEGWKVGCLGSICEVIDCLHTKKPERAEEGRPLLQLWNIRNDGLLDMSDTYWIDEADYEKWIARIEASPGDCVITNVGRVGAVAQIPHGFKAALGRNMTGLRCRRHFIFPTFLIECLLSDSMSEEIRLKIDSGTILDSLNVRSIPYLRFVLATSNTLQSFEKLARPFRERMEKCLELSFSLSSLRDTLLPKLISGEIRVKDADKFVERTV